MRAIFVCLLAPVCLSSQPPAQSTGIVRVLGNSHMETLMTAWEAGFRRHHPDATFQNKYLGTANAIAGLYLETADLALMGREIMPMEDIAYRRVFPAGPLGLAVATASFNVPLETFAFAIFVNRHNPIERLTLRQLEGIFGCERKLGTPAAIRTWGDLGLAGDWATRAIHLHGYEISSGLGYFFQQRVLGGSHKWNCGLAEYANAYAPDRKLLANAGDLIVKAVEEDEGAIGFCGFGHATAGVKALALSEDARNYVPLTRENVANRTYPLTRTVYIYINRTPATPLVREFLRYVLSAEGQKDVTMQDVYLPLPAETMRGELAKLGATAP
jgi:phosphate transport system substrate-binding protein